MSFLMRQVAHCDVCGHEWLTNKVPSHCAKCKSRRWNKDAIAYFKDMGAAVPVQSGRAARVPSDGAALSRAKKAVPAKSSIQPIDGSAVFMEHPRKMVHGAHPVLDASHHPRCTCHTCKPPKPPK